jgi:hypothetical protein
MLFFTLVIFVAVPTLANQSGTSGTVTGTVVDPSGAIISGATVEIQNPVSQYDRTTTTDASGTFSFLNVPFNPYHLTVTSAGFTSMAQDVDVRSAVPISLKISLAIASTSNTVTVQAEAGDLIENDPTFHTDIDRTLIDRLPLASTSSSVSALVTQTTPGISADSNGLIHGLGDHAENSFSVDGQPITDQQSKVFSNQIPIESIQSLEVIAGAPPAEYGDKTSVVINVTTRSGLGETTPHGNVTASYGSFGTTNAGFDFGVGNKKWGNFIAASGLNTGRFLDPPEFTVVHAKGNQQNVFDRVDFQVSNADSIHLNAQYTRSWFQTPNSFDSEFASPWNGVVVDNAGIGPNGEVVGPTDQRSQIQTFNIAPSWTHLFGSNAVFTLGGFVRHDAYNYYPSRNPFADLGPPSLQRESVAQDRTLTNAGAHSEFSYTRGIQTIKAGIAYQQTFLNENDHLGIVDPILNAPCLTLSTAPNPNSPVQGFTDPAACAANNLAPNTAANPNAPNSALVPLFKPVLLPFDLTRSGSLFDFVGHADIKELSLFIEDNINWKNWSFNLGIRGDVYNGITSAQQAEPRVGIAYNIKRTNTVLRVSYARTLETPFNENLILSSVGCESEVLNPLLSCSSSSLTPISPGFRNEFHAGFQQAFGKYVAVDGEYIWKYTHNAYDFSVLGNTPITFPIQWHNSKIPGFAIRTNLTNFHGLTGFVVMSSVSARFFTPQLGGAGSVPAAIGPFRIDHDERFNQTAHLQYQPRKTSPWVGFSWRYDSGQVAGATPCFGLEPFNTCPGSFIDLVTGAQTISLVASNAGNVPLSADQQFQAGFSCNGVFATPPSAANPAGTPISATGTCPAAQFASNLIRVPAPNKEDADHNPPRIAPRNVFDIALGDDNIFRSDRHRWSAQITVINLTNKYALYNFLSTFSGTHYLTPRAITGEIGFHF